MSNQVSSYSRASVCSVPNMLLVPTRTGEAPLLSAQRRR